MSCTSKDAELAKLVPGGLWAIARKIHAVGAVLETWQPEMTRNPEMSASGLGLILMEIANQLEIIVDHYERRQ